MEEIVDSKTDMNMKNNVKILLISLLLGISTLITFAANMEADNDSIICLRPITKDTKIDIDKKHYEFYAGEYVRVESKNNGNIIIDGDTLATDTVKPRITDYKKNREVGIEYMNSFPDFKSCFTIVDSAELVVDLSKTTRKGTLRIFKVKDKYFNVNYGNCDTFKLSAIGLSVIGDSLKYIPDSIPGGFIATSKIPVVNNSTTIVNKPWYLNKFVACITIIIIVVIIIAFLILRRRKRIFHGNDKVKNATIKELNRLQNLLDKIQETFADEEAKESKLYRDILELDKSISRLNEFMSKKTTTYIIESDQICRDICKYTNLIRQSCKEARGLGTDIQNCTECIENYIEQFNTVSVDGDGVYLPRHINDSDCNRNASDQLTDAEKVDKLSQECINLKGELARIQLELRRTSDYTEELCAELSKEKSNRDEIIKQKVSDAKVDFDRRVDKIKSAAEHDIRLAKERADKAEGKANTIAGELTKKFDVERKRLVDDKNAINEKLRKTKDELSATTQRLASETNAHLAAKRTVEQLTAETKAFNERLSGVTDSLAYCEKIYELVKLSEDIQTTASDMLQSNLSDPYFAYKALALFCAKLNSINLPNFYTDVEMISKTGFVIKGTPLASYDKKQSAKELENLTKNYFFITYLKSYIDALVVLNESLIGMKYLIDDVKPSHIRAFENYRDKLNELVLNLGIQVLTVKVFDGIGVNTDLLATEIDAGYDKHGAILEIENCKVCLIGGKPDPRRIVVKIQK